MRTLASFFAPILQRNVDEEHKVIVKNDAPVVEESKRKRPTTAKKAASLSVTLRQSRPWAVVVTEPDPAPFTALASDSETNFTGQVEFRERGERTVNTHLCLGTYDDVSDYWRRFVFFSPTFLMCF